MCVHVCQCTMGVSLAAVAHDCVPWGNVCLVVCVCVAEAERQSSGALLLSLLRRVRYLCRIFNFRLISVSVDVWDKRVSARVSGCVCLCVGCCCCTGQRARTACALECEKESRVARISCRRSLTLKKRNSLCLFVAHCERSSAPSPSRPQTSIRTKQPFAATYDVATSSHVTPAISRRRACEFFARFATLQNAIGRVCFLSLSLTRAHSRFLSVSLSL